MDIQIQELDSSGRLLTVALPDEEVQGEVVERLKKMCRTVTIPGFRKGRTPFKVVESRFRESVFRNVLTDFARDSAETYMKENSINPVYGPVMRDYSSEQSMHKFELFFEVLPRLSQWSIAGQEIIEPKVEITDADVLEEVENWRKDNRKWVVVDRSAKQADRVTVDVTTKINDEVVDDGGQKNLVIAIPSDEDEFEDDIDPGDFDSALIGKACTGLKAGDEVTVPAGLEDAAEGSDPSTYTIKVHSVEESTNEFTDNFLKFLGVQSEAEENFLSHARKLLEQDFRNIVEEALKRQVVEILLDRNNFVAPRSLIEAEVRHRTKEMGYSVEEFEESGMDWMKTEVGQFIRSYIEKQIVDDLVDIELLSKNTKLIDSSDETFQAHTQELVSLSPNPEETKKSIEENSDKYKTNFGIMQVIRGLASEGDYEVRSMTVQEFHEWVHRLNYSGPGEDDEQQEDEAATENLIVDSSGQPIRE